MKRTLPRARPGSRSKGRALVAQADHHDLLKRHEAVRSLVARALADIAAIEGAMATAGPALARKMELEIGNERRFLALLDARLLVLAADLADHERRQMDMLALPPGAS